MNLKPDGVFIILKECYLPQWAYISLAGIVTDCAADKIIFIMITAFILSPWHRLSDLGFAEFNSTSIPVQSYSPCVIIIALCYVKLGIVIQCLLLLLHIYMLFACPIRSILVAHITLHVVIPLRAGLQIIETDHISLGGTSPLNSSTDLKLNFRKTAKYTDQIHITEIVT